MSNRVVRMQIVQKDTWPKYWWGGLKRIISIQFLKILNFVLWIIINNKILYNINYIIHLLLLYWQNNGSMVERILGDSHTKVSNK